MWSLQLFEGCLQSLRGRGQRSATNELYHSSVTAQGRNQGVGSSSSCTTRLCRSLRKSTCPSGGEASTRPQRGMRQQTLGSTSRRMPRCPSTRFQGKTSCDCSATSSTSGIRKSRGGRVSYSSRTYRARETGTFANHPADLLSDHLLSSGSTQCCGDSTLPSHACDRRIHRTNRSRWSSIPHCSSSGESTAFFSTPSSVAQKAMRRKCSVRSDVASEQNNVQMCRWRVPWLRRKAQQDDADDCRVGKHGYT